MTVLSGTILSPSGTPVSGALYLGLSQDANMLSGGGAVAAIPPRIFNLTAGAISGPGAGPYSVPGAAELTPAGLTYHLTATGPGGEIVLERDIIITGTSVDLGTIVSVTAPSAPLPFSVLGGDATGPAASTTVGSIRNRPLSTLAPTPGQSLNWNGSAWAPLTPAAGPLGTIASDGSVPLTANWNAGNFRIHSQNSVDVFNVTAYGAVGNGIADDTVAIKAAAAAAAAAGGGSVYVPFTSSYYKTIAKLSLASNVWLVSNGATIWNVTSVEPTVEMLGTLGTFSLLTVDGIDETYGVTVASAAGFAVGDMVEIEDQVTGDVEANAIVTIVGTAITLMYPLTRAYSIANTSRLLLVNAVSSVVVRDITLRSTNDRGLRFKWSRHGLFTNVWLVSPATTGFDIQVALDWTITGCHVSAAGGSGVGPSVGVVSARDGFIVDNWIYDQRGVEENIVLYKRCQQITITRNHCLQRGVAPTGGVSIQLDIGNRYNVIANNLISRAVGYGIYLTGGGNLFNQIFGNEVVACLLDGIRLENAENVNIIAHNVLRNGGGWGLSLGASAVGNEHFDNIYSNNVSGSVNDLQSLPPDVYRSGKQVVAGLVVAAAPTFSALTTGSVPFAGAAGLLSQDNANFFWDNTNKRLGIGTAGPGAKLDIQVASTNGLPTTALRLSEAGAAFGGSGSSIDFYNQDNGGVNLAARIGSSLISGGANAQASDLLFYTTAVGLNTEKMRITSTGNVGIGTTTPNVTADVNGALATRTGTVAVVAGLNSNIATPAFSYVRLTGPAAVFSIGGFTLPSDGRILMVQNTVAFAMTIVNEDALSTATNRITTLTGGNVTLRAGTSACTLIYDITATRWILMSTN